MQIFFFKLPKTDILNRLFPLSCFLPDSRPSILFIFPPGKYPLAVMEQVKARTGIQGKELAGIVQSTITI